MNFPEYTFVIQGTKLNDYIKVNENRYILRYAALT